MINGIILYPSGQMQTKAFETAPEAFDALKELSLKNPGANAMFIVCAGDALEMITDVVVKSLEVAK